MSVWDGINRNEFDHDLAGLCKAGKFQDALRYPALSPRIGHEAESSQLELTAGVECQLADDCAFLASWTTWPRHVAASTVHRSSETAGLCISISANQGIEECVKASFEAVVKIIERRASREISRRDAERLCIDTILPLHRDRIFGRLGSKKTEGQRTSQVCLLERVRALSQRVASRMPQNGKDHQQLLRHFGRLERCISTLDTSTPYSDEERDQLRELLRAAYEVTNAGDSLIARLQKAGCQTVSKQSREIREITALGNYCRICRYLAQIAGRYKDWFSSVELNVIETRQPKRRRGLTQYVHAEIQLLTHFELHPASRPRYIAASKKPCFLCYCFIRAHGFYGIGKSHGEVFEQWTVPDDGILGPQSRGRLCVALLQTERDIKAAIKRAKTRHRVALQPPSQTVSKLQLYTLSSPVTSSRTITASEHVSVGSDGERQVMSAGLQIGTVHSSRPGTRPPSLTQDLRSMAEAESDSNQDSQSHHDGGTLDRTISIHRPFLFHGEGLQLQITSESAEESRKEIENTEEIHSEDDLGIRCKIQPIRDIESNTMQRVVVTDIPVDNAITIQRTSSAGLRFVIVGPLSSFLVEIAWHERCF